MNSSRELTNAAEVKDHGLALRVFLSRKGPRSIAKIAGATWGLRALLGPPGVRDVVAAAAAVAVWPIQEWVLHKYVLHLDPRRLGGFDPSFARAHRTHHADPRDIDTTLLPPEVIRAAGPGAALIWFLVFGPSRATLTAMATYSTMALFYEWTHFIVHTNVKPRTRYGAQVRRNHRLHHFRHEQYWFAFTLPLVDRWFGTDPDPDTIERSRTAMDLFGLAS